MLRWGVKPFGEERREDPYHCVGVEGVGVVQRPHYFSVAVNSIKLRSSDHFNTICFCVIRSLMMNEAKKFGSANNAERRPPRCGKVCRRIQANEVSGVTMYPSLRLRRRMISSTNICSRLCHNFEVQITNVRMSRGRWKPAKVIDIKRRRREGSSCL